MKSNILRQKDGKSRKMRWDIYKVLLIKSLYFLCGIMSTQGVICGDCNPFGIPLTSVVSKKYLVSTVAGVLLGYFCSSSFSKGIGYISIIIIVLSIRWTLSESGRIKKHKLYIPAICFIPTFIIEAIINYPGDININYVYIVLTESLIAAISGYFFDRTFKIIDSNTPLFNDASSKIKYPLVSIFIIILSMLPVTVYKLSLGRIIAIVIILLSAYLTGSYGGGIAGILAGSVFGLSSFGMAYISGVYALGGLCAGMCANLGGKFHIGISFLLCGVIYLFNIAVSSNIVTISMYEIFVGVLLFLLMPKNIICLLGALFSSYRKINNSVDKNTDEVDKFIGDKKEYISETIKSISDVAKSIIPETFQESNFELENICMKSVYKICNKCNLRVLCWEKEGEIAHKYFNWKVSGIINSLDDRDSLYDCSIDKRCKKLDDITKSIIISKNNFLAGSEVKKRAEELHDGMSEKFSIAEALLGYASEGIEASNTEDIDSSKRIKRLLGKYGIKAVRVECAFNCNKKIFIEIEVMKVNNRNLLSPKIINELSLICGRRLGDPVIIDIENRTLIRVTERTIFDVDIYVSGHTCNNGKFCGDCCSYFKDGVGNFSAVISDGMGTGGRAAADGAVTSGIIERLIKLRVKPSSAIKIANLSMLGKSENESLTAVDIMKFDLFSGEAEFIKAGAPLTFVKKGQEINKIDAASLPIGIFNETNMSVNKMKFGQGDLILMVSDGVTDVGIDWVEDEFRKFSDNSVQKLSEHILNMTLERRILGNDDDITVVSIKIKKNCV